MPLHTLRADIDYGFAEAKTTFGRIGVKVWINKGEIMPAGFGGRDRFARPGRRELEGLGDRRIRRAAGRDREGLGPVASAAVAVAGRRWSAATVAEEPARAAGADDQARRRPRARMRPRRPETHGSRAGCPETAAEPTPPTPDAERRGARA